MRYVIMALVLGLAAASVSAADEVDRLLRQYAPQDVAECREAAREYLFEASRKISIPEKVDRASEAMRHLLIERGPVAWLAFEKELLANQHRLKKQGVFFESGPEPYAGPAVHRHHPYGIVSLNRLLANEKLKLSYRWSMLHGIGFRDSPLHDIDQVTMLDLLAKVIRDRSEIGITFRQIGPEFETHPRHACDEAIDFIHRRLWSDPRLDTAGWFDVDDQKRAELRERAIEVGLRWIAAHRQRQDLRAQLVRTLRQYQMLGLDGEAIEKTLAAWKALDHRKGVSLHGNLRNILTLVDLYVDDVHRRQVDQDELTARTMAFQDAIRAALNAELAEVGPQLEPLTEARRTQVDAARVWLARPFVEMAEQAIRPIDRSRYRRYAERIRTYEPGPQEDGGARAERE